MRKSYQRRHLRAPFNECVLYADGGFVQKAKALNISEGGLLLEELPSFPDNDEVYLMLSLPQLPYFKNFGLIKMQTFSRELLGKNVFRALVRMVRREELSHDLSNIFKSRFGLEFVKIGAREKKLVEDYVSTFTSNIIYLQTLIDTFNSDEEARMKTRTLAKILGYSEVEKISQLRSAVTHDYKSLQWL